MSDGEELADALQRCRTLLSDLEEMRAEFSCIRDDAVRLRSKGLEVQRAAETIIADMQAALDTAEARTEEGRGMAQIVAELIRRHGGRDDADWWKG